MVPSLPLTPLLHFRGMLLDRAGDDYGEKAVILVLVVLGGVAAFTAFGGRIVDLIGQATSGI